MIKPQIVSLLIASFIVIHCTRKEDHSEPTETVTILATNDIHGGLEPSREGGEILGGMALLSGAVKAIREGVRKSPGAEVFLVDAGDQFQGTLLSNFDEGELVIRTMREIGFDAAVPGNHDYDFGPQGWTKDKITKGEPEENSKEIFRKLIRIARPEKDQGFPFLSANTYFIKELKNLEGKPLGAVDQNFCRTKNGEKINWAAAKPADFLQPFTILKSDRISARIAVIGLDNPKTASQTMFENVSDLCFRDPAETYLELHDQLKDQADIFIIVIHDGDTDKSNEATKLAQRLVRDGEPQVDAIIAGHTHYVNDTRTAGIPIIQSGSSARKFGRIDLVFGLESRKVLRDRTRQVGGVKLYSDKCDPLAKFCEKKDGKVFYNGVELRSDEAVTRGIQTARQKLGGMDKTIVADAKQHITRHRIAESALSNIMASGLLKLAKLQEPKTDIAFVNASGLRVDVEEGPVTFEEFYAILPFNNRGVVVGPAKTKDVIELLKYTVTTCNRFGTLIPAGLKVTFERSCPKDDDLDPLARLVKVDLVKADDKLETIYDIEKKIAPQDEDQLLLATLDFLASGGDGFLQLKLPVMIDFGVVRDELFKMWSKNPPTWRNELDDRWKWLPRAGLPRGRGMP